MFSLSWEKLVADPENWIARIPGLITEAFLEAEEFEVYDALMGTKSVAGVGLLPGTTILGKSTVKNAPISRDALEVAIKQLRTRQIDGRPAHQGTSFTLVVPIGAREGVEFMLNAYRLEQLQVSDGSGTTEVLAVNAGNPTQGITKIVESEWVTGTQWFLMPTKGTTKRPGLQLLKLRGHEQPDIRLDGATGVREGGGAVGPFEGTFDTDDVAIRGRLPLQGVAWTPAYVLYSDGTGQ